MDYIDRASLNPDGSVNWHTLIPVGKYAGHTIYHRQFVLLRTVLVKSFRIADIYIN